MAQKVTTSLIDDIDDTEADESILFALDGTTYEIDLNKSHADELREAFAVWIGHARKHGPTPRKTLVGRTGRTVATGGASVKTDKERVHAIREWGKAHGYKVSERGRLGADLIAAYDADN